MTTKLIVRCESKVVRYVSYEAALEIFDHCRADLAEVTQWVASNDDSMERWFTRATIMSYIEANKSRWMVMWLKAVLDQMEQQGSYFGTKRDPYEVICLTVPPKPTQALAGGQKSIYMTYDVANNVHTLSEEAPADDKALVHVFIASKNHYNQTFSKITQLAARYASTCKYGCDSRGETVKNIKFDNICAFMTATNKVCKAYIEDDASMQEYYDASIKLQAERDDIVNSLSEYIEKL